MTNLVEKYADSSIDVKKELYDAVFLDFNDTIIKTGILSPQEIVWENDKVFDFMELLKIIGDSYEKINKVFYLNIVTGNSYDYIRGRLEIFDLHMINNVNFNIVTENGLFAQSQKIGMLWSGVPDNYYTESIKKLDTFAVNNFPEKFFLQGNMIRRTYKPAGLGFDKDFIESVMNFAQKECNMKMYDGLWDSGNGIMYYHVDDALDFDPRNVRMVYKGEMPDQDIVFKGKGFAVEKIYEWFNYKNSMAFGDSKNDLPMFEEIRKHKGQVFAVSNHKFSEEQIKKAGIKAISRPRIEAINTVLATWITKMNLE